MAIGACCKSSKRPHIVLYPFPAHGHATPALMLAQQLVSSGADVSFITFPDRLPKLKKTLAMQKGSSEEDGDSSGIRFVPLNGRLPPPSAHGHDSQDVMVFLINRVYETQPLFEAEVERMNAEANLEGAPAAPAILLGDNLISWIQDVANRLGIPRYIFYPSPAYSLACLFYVKSMVARNVLPLKTGPDATEEELVVKIPGMPPIRTIHMDNYLQDLSPKEGVDFFAMNCLRIHEAAGVLINTFAEAELKPLNAMLDEEVNPNKVPVIPVGPLLPKGFFDRSLLNKSRSLLPHEERCIQWLKKRSPRSVVYISFGSIKSHSKEQAQELALGLKSSGHCFMWVLHPDSAAAAELKSVLPEEMWSGGDDQGFITSDWAPQLLILSDPAVGGFLTHCGWNSTLESLCSGVPLLTMPSFADQVLNSKMIVDEWKVGLEMCRGDDDLVGREDVAKKIKALMEDTEEAEIVRKNVKKLVEDAQIAYQTSAPQNIRAILPHKKP